MLFHCLGSARGCPGSTCISLVWLDRCNTSLFLSLSLTLLRGYRSGGMPGIVTAWELVPSWGGGGGGVGGDTAAVLPGLKLGIASFFLVQLWTIHMFGSYHLISQAGWNRCNPLYSTSRRIGPPLVSMFSLVILSLHLSSRSLSVGVAWESLCF